MLYAAFLAQALAPSAAVATPPQPRAPLRNYVKADDSPQGFPSRSVRAVAPEPARAMANLPSYLRDDDYPMEAVRGEQHGTVVFRLDIAANGRVSNCTVIASSGSPILDATTCRLMTERPRFTPARNTKGRAVPDVVESRIRWLLPDSEFPLSWIDGHCAEGKTSGK